MIGTTLDQFACVSTFLLVMALLLSESLKLDVVLTMLLLSVLFAWLVEKNATP